MRRTSLLLLLVFPLVLTLAAVSVRPVWDDGWLALLLLDERVDIRAYMGDRPLLGTLWQWCSQLGVLWESGYLFHYVGWVSVGLITVKLWGGLFPEMASQSVLVGAWAIAPVLAETQLLLINTMLASQIPIVLVYVGALAMMWTARSKFSAVGKVCLHGLALLLILITTQVSEYAVAAAFAASVLLAGLLYKEFGARRSTTFIPLAFAGTAIVGYTAYWVLSDPAARENVRPELLLGSGGLFYRAQVAGARLFSDAWLLVAGKTAASLANITLGRTYVEVTGAVLAVCMGVLLAVIYRHETSVDKGQRRSLPSMGGSALILLTALLAGLLPVVMMGRSGSNGGMATRVWLPVLPVAACASYAVIAAVLGRNRTWATASVVGFLIVYSTFGLFQRTSWVEEQTRSWGDRVRASLSSEGINVAVFVCDDPRWKALVDYELTARVTQGWAQEQVERFWALPDLVEAEEFEGERIWGAGFPPGMINRRVRGVERIGPIKRLILVVVEPDGNIRIQRLEADHRSLGLL